MKNLTLILIILLMAACVVIYLLIRERSIAQRDRTLEAREFRSKAKESLSKIEARDAQISTLLNDRAEDSVRQVKKEASFISRISALKSRVTGPAVVQDTIIVIQDSLISVVRNSRHTLYITDNQVIDSLQRQVSDISGLFQGQLKQSMKMESELERQKKKRIVVSLGVNYSPLGNQITPGVHIGWCLVRF